MLGKRSLARPRSGMLDTFNYWRQGLSSPRQGIKDPGNKDVLENGTCENIKREAINWRLQIAGQDFTHA